MHLLSGHLKEKNSKRILNELIAQGKLIRNRKGLYLPVHEAKLVTGYFEAHRNGFGFVIPDSPKETDIFIPPNATMGAMHGDRVVARLEHRREKRRKNIRILERTVNALLEQLKIRTDFSHSAKKEKA